MPTTPSRFNKIFPTSKPVIAMIHVDALPGTPRHQFSIAEITDHAIREAELYRRAGVDVIAIENMHDIPYLKHTGGPEIVAAMTMIGQAIKATCGLPCGLQILAGANTEAMAAAHAAQLDFIRVEGYVFGHVADEGYIDASAGELKRYQKQIGAEGILIFTDIKKKHSAHAVTGDVDIAETAHAAEFFLSDGVIVTGPATGLTADLADVSAVKNAVEIPVLIGSGVTLDNVAACLKHSDGLIVGSYFKTDGYWANSVDYDRTAAFMEAVKALRG